MKIEKKIIQKRTYSRITVYANNRSEIVLMESSRNFQFVNCRNELNFDIGLSESANMCEKARRKNSENFENFWISCWFGFNAAYIRFDFNEMKCNVRFIHSA